MTTTEEMYRLEILLPAAPTARTVVACVLNLLQQQRDDGVCRRFAYNIPASASSSMVTGFVQYDFDKVTGGARRAPCLVVQADYANKSLAAAHCLDIRDAIKQGAIRAGIAPPDVSICGFSVTVYT